MRSGLGVNDIRAVANNDFIEEHPDAAAVLEAVEIPLALADIDAEMNAAGDSYTEADIAQDAADWIEANSGTVDGWLEQARSAS
ncbi:MAG TPA: glycine betaine ABC transporter substrate-binding protein [Euzebyales bacterium]|nr:glycine betaine ABC transporter substrate-binding protein [Euzebyales bacterium]